MALTRKTFGITLVIAAIIISFIFIYISSGRNLTGLEATLFQVLSLGLGLAGSYIVGSTREAAEEIVKPYAKSAFRRLLSHYRSLSRVATVIQNSRTNDTEQANSPVLDIVEAIVTEQLDTAGDALEDWRDIVPDEVEKVQLRMEAQRTQQQKLTQ